MILGWYSNLADVHIPATFIFYYYYRNNQGVCGIAEDNKDIGKSNKDIKKLGEPVHILQEASVRSSYKECVVLITYRATM